MGHPFVSSGVAHGHRPQRSVALEIERLGTISNQLGEGPLWDPRLNALFWVDSVSGEIFRLKEGVTKRYAIGQMIGSMAIHDDSRAIVSLISGFAWYDFDAERLTPIHDPEEDRPETRFNDGKTDRQGNFVTGSMGIAIRDRALGCLYRLRLKDDELRVERLEEDVVVANGPCFSPDGSVFYFNDGRRRMLAYDYDPNGPLRNKRVFFDGEAHGTGSDGATVDAQGNIWTALVGSGEVACLSPTGKFLERIEMPVDLPSSVMFGGANLDELYVTSIRDSGNRKGKAPQAGAIFRITGLGVTGLAERRFMEA